MMGDLQRGFCKDCDALTSGHCWRHPATFNTATPTHTFSSAGPTRAELIRDLAAARTQLETAQHQAKVWMDYGRGQHEGYWTLHDRIKALCDSKGSGFPYVSVTDLWAAMDLDTPLAAVPDSTERCPQCGVVCPDADAIERRLMHAPYCSMTPTPP